MVNNTGLLLHGGHDGLRWCTRKTAKPTAKAKTRATAAALLARGLHRLTLARHSDWWALEALAAMPSISLCVRVSQ
eukprot:4769193-Amphidinium_carterae.2